ncbi:PAS domain S-box protein [Allocoleopsis franciscana]|uniref:histidine kinase n=1 Tax=Allocoleopsis franciscana PCC 7113 TaxID=1173027 RepID=K9WCW5_9CYAN|nr:PAS domain S-box protein [Allocoleopsis franciscana]AFZ17574.1 PAS domain S-box [Allocoleopsis franciscana PCC 7113]
MEDSITQSHQSEATLSKSELRWRRISARVPGVIYQFLRYPDGTLAFPFISPSCRRIFEVEAIEIEADASVLMSMIHPQDEEDFNRSVTHSIETLQPWSWEGRFILPSGQIKWIQAASAPERQADGEILWDGLLIDITARKQAEDELWQTRKELEHSVEERTGELSPVNEPLRFTQFSMDYAPEAILWMDGEAHFFYVNEAACQMLGYSRKELLSMSVYDVDPNLPAQSWPEYRKKLKPLGSVTLESTNRAKDGRIFPVEISINHLEFKGQEYNCIFVRDISERYKAKEALQQSEQKFRSMVENANDIIYQLTPDGIFSYVSPNWVELLGHEISEVEGKVFTLFVHPDDVPVCLGTLRRAIEKAQNQSGVEYRVRHKTGTWRWYISNLSLLRDASGRVVSVIGIARDISDRKQAEDALRESEERFRNLVESTNDFIWEVDRNAIYTYVSPQIKDTLGYEVAEVLGKTPFDFMPSEEACCVSELMSNRVALRQSITNLENSNFHKDGHIVVLEMSGVPFFDQAGNFQGYRGIDRDITKRKQTEEAVRQSKVQLQRQANQLEQTLRKLQNTQAQLIQTEKMSSLGQLVAGMAHEINNPINFIYGNINHAHNYISDLFYLINLYQKNLPHSTLEIAAKIDEVDLDFVIEDFPKLLDSMKLGAERIRKIVQSLSTFSRVDEAAVKEVDIHQGIDSTLILLEGRLKPPLNSQTIQVIKDYSNLPLVKCYPGELNQVFMNLLNNAIDALEKQNRHQNFAEISANPGMIKIRTEISSKSASKPWIVIRIVDNGSGMTEEVSSRAFDPFFTTKPVGEGTGLGLAISYQIVVELHKGRLYCISSPGQGTEFVIELPNF